MARPTRSRIIPADSQKSDVIEKWPTPKTPSPKSNIVPFGNRAQKSADNRDVERRQAEGLEEEPAVSDGMTQSQSVQDEVVNNGYTEEMRIALSQIAEQQKQLASLLTALENPVGALNDTVAQELLLLSKDIARSVLEREVQQDPSLFGEFVMKAIAQLPAAIGPPVVSAHPEDLKILKELGAPALTKVSIRWAEDPNAVRGNFRVKRHGSVIHGGIDAMLQQALSQSEVSS